MGNEDLVVTGRSEYHIRDGIFVVAIAAALLFLQFLVYVLKWTDSPILFPFGLFAGCVALIGLLILALGARALRCRLCGVGLYPDRFVMVSKSAAIGVADALARGDAAAIVGAIAARPRQSQEHGVRLCLEYCPKCGRVVVAHLEQGKAFGSPSPRRVLAGDEATALLEISEIDLG
ncbi:hypothetical protein ACQEV2_43190 [Streptomyces sp. CA-251387]|uniref:hypothetical protein n=1 Tax=Streptomyces sp. CA-251387 TaxID=3240064 RepID=UPI003D92CADD